jgi:hypothetical protein
MMLLTRRAVGYVLVALVVSLPAAAQITLDTIGPRVGSAVPEFSGVDQFGNRQTLATVLGPNGAMLVFFRSADW